MSSTLNLIRRLKDRRIEFVVVGGIAANVHGSPRTTYDLDLCAPLDRKSCESIIAAIADLNPRFRTRPDLPVITPADPNLTGIKNLYLRTDMLMLDVLGNIDGVGDFEACARESDVIDLQGTHCRILRLEALIRAKRATGRNKDVLDLIELEALLTARGK